MGIRPTVVRLLLVVPLLAAGMALGTRTGMAAATPCATTINGGTIKDSVVVKAPDTCILSGVTVPGRDHRRARGELPGYQRDRDPRLAHRDGTALLRH